MDFIRKTYLIIKRVITKILSLIELFLFLRLILMFFNANPVSPVVNAVYRFSDVFISPFEFIFPIISWNGRIIETVTISAMVGYVIFVYIFLRILRLFSRN